MNTQIKNEPPNRDRHWTVLLIGGASGTGKSSLAYRIADLCAISVLEVDDVFQAVKAVTAKEILPAMHYWSDGINWTDIGVSGNVNWLINAGKEMAPALKAIVDRHIEDKVPVIIEGDFICPEFAMSFDHPEVKSLFVTEPDREQLLQNFFAREGGDLQHFRADVSAAHGDWISETCRKLGIELIESRPWDTVLHRAVSCMRDR